MRKKRSLIILIVLIPVVILLSYFLFIPKTIIRGDLSDRALEFIEKNEGDLGKANLTPSEKRINESISVEDCYSFVFPFDLNTSREQALCNWIYNTKNPIARVVVNLKDTSIENLEDLPDVNLRKSRPEYAREDKTLNGNSYYIFEKQENGYEISAFSLKEGKVLTVSLTSQTNRELKNGFEKLLESFKF